MSTGTGGAQRCRPKSNSAPGPASSNKVGKLKNLSKGAFDYETLDGSTSGTSAAGARSLKSRGDDQIEVECSCESYLGSKAKQLGGRNRSKKVSRIRGEGKHEPSPAASGFLFRLLTSYGWLRESIRTTNLTVYDLCVGNQMMFLMTSCPIPWAKTKPGSPGSSSGSRRLAMLPVTSFPRSSSSSTLGKELPDVSFKSSKSFPAGGRGCVDSNAGRCLLSSRR